jgi:hypothetical protein
MQTPSEVKARANKLRDVLSGMGHQLKHSESLEVISKMEGYPDWNTYTADISKQEQFFERYPTTKNPETTKTTPDHPIVDAIKLDNEVLLRKSLSSEVLSNKMIMAEAFYQSVVLERLALAELMIEAGADVSSVVIRGRPLFEFVIHTERADYMKMLVLKFKHLKDMHPKDSAVLPMVISVLSKDDDALEPIKILLDQGANINAPTRGGETAVILAGYVREDLDLVKLLVERGADINLANDNGDTPLIDAAEKGNIELLEYLLNNGADVGIKNNSGITALARAEQSGKTEALKIIAKRT